MQLAIAAPSRCSRARKLATRSEQLRCDDNASSRNCNAVGWGRDADESPILITQHAIAQHATDRAGRGLPTVHELARSACIGGCVMVLVASPLLLRWGDRLDGLAVQAPLHAVPRCRTTATITPNDAQRTPRLALHR